MFDKVTANIITIFTCGGGAVGYCDEYQTVYDAMTTSPGDTDAGNQNTWSKGLVDDGVWAELDVLYNMAVHTNDDAESQINWKNPGTNDITLVNAPPFTAYEGFAATNTAYIDTNFDPSTGSKWTQNNAGIFEYLRKDVTSNYDFIWGLVVGGNRIRFYAASEADMSGSACVDINNSGNTITALGVDNKGFYYQERTASNAWVVYKNNSSIGSGSDDSSGVPNGYSMVILGQNNSGSVTGEAIDAQASIFGMGAALEAKRTNLFNHCETYMDANGKGVVA